jgi:hypothetical protein
MATVDAFNVRTGPTTIDGVYPDGVSVTHGAQGSRTHIWSFAAAGSSGSVCPCSNDFNHNRILSPPDEVGVNYFCDRSDHVWTGENCPDDFSCCSFNNPPYFSVQLPSATTDRIEIRICTDQRKNDEVVSVLLAEFYVQ